jgi:class 3 adenylate cyclase/tetratricopeptide (TPR) repeat protein
MAGAGERRVVTILFADVIGSTSLGEQLDPERMQAILAEYFAAMAAVVADWGGTIEKYIGDALMAVFGLPRIREDDAHRALSAALGMMGRLEGLEAGFRGRHGVSLSIRIGVNTGEVIAPADGPAQQLLVTGDAVNTASRLQASARPGSILVGERTYLAARDAFRFAEPQALAVAGKADPVLARALLERLPEPRRGIPGLSAAMVGRERELGTLVGLLEEASERGEPRLAIVYGPAGIGKSRLVAELVDRAAVAIPNARTLRGRCLAVGHGVTYWALTEILRSACGIGLDDEAALVLRKLSTTVEETFRDRPEGPYGRETVAALAASAGIDVGDDERLVGSEPRLVGDAIGRAWPRFLTAMSADGPIILVIEDLHWAGDQLLETLGRIASRTDGPVLVLGTARPEFGERVSRLGTGASATSIALQALTADQSDAVIDDLLDINDLPAERRAAIVERAEGNPFFLEEILRRLIDERAVILDGGHWRATAGIHEIHLPDSVQALLAARVDGLPIAERQVLREAAVIGRVFWPGPLRSAGLAIDVDAALGSLEERGLVVARSTSTVVGETEHQFRHALVRDVAYEALPRARRARAHANVAEWTARLASGRADEFAELVGYHYRLAAAGDDADLAWSDQPERRTALRADAFAWLIRAGDGARRRYALDTAVDLHHDALELAADEADRVTAQEALGDDHAAAFQGEEAKTAYISALEVQTTVGDERTRARLLMKLARLASQQGGALREAVPWATVESWIEAGLGAAPDELTRAWLLSTRADVDVGETDDPSRVGVRMEAARQALVLARRLGERSLEFQVLGSLAQLNEAHGRWEEVRIAEEAIVEIIPDLDLAGRAHAAVSAAEFLSPAGDLDRAASLAREALLASRDLSTHERLHASAILLDILARGGRWDEALALLDEHLEGYRDEQVVQCVRNRSGPMYGAWVLANRGLRDEAYALLEAVPLREPRLDTRVEATRARCLVALGDPAEARTIAEGLIQRRELLGRPLRFVALLESLEAAAAWGDVPAALTEAAPMVAGDVMLATAADRVGGTAVAVAGDHAGTTMLERSLETALRHGLRFEAARAREALATYGGTADGRSRLEAALSDYDGLGATPHSARVASLLADYDATAASS